MSNLISDIDFAVPEDIEIALPTKTEGQFFYIRLQGGISTRLYLKMLRYSEQLSQAQTDNDAIEILHEIALSVIREDSTHKDISRNYFVDNLNNYVVIKRLVTEIYKTISELGNHPGLKLPQLNSKNQVAEQPEEDGEIMRDIAFLTTHTAHTYQDVLDMPYVTFLSLLKHLVLNKTLENPEYREQYEKQKLMERIKAGRNKKTKLDLAGLKRFAAGL